MGLLHAAAILAFASLSAAQETTAPAPARHAQPNARYELGWRMRQLERAWPANATSEVRRSMLPFVESAVQHFFALRVPQAAEALDRAVDQLSNPCGGCNWTRAWAFTPEARLLDSSSGSLALDARAFYEPCGGTLDRLSVSAHVHGASDRMRLGDLTGPQVLTLSLEGVSAGDHRLSVHGFNGDFCGSDHDLIVSIVDKRDERLAALETALDKLPDTAPRLERETARALLALLKSLAAGSTEETDYPGARLLAEAEQVVAAAAKGERWYDSAKSGQFWLAVPTSEKRTTRVRVFLPPRAANAPKPPLVVALHGAGGSENLFFDGYGDGEIVRQCERRGWMLVAPRLGFGGAPVAALVDELATRFAFDTTRVFVVGHSMGAAAGTSVVLADPARYRAFAALGGGTNIEDATSLKELPIFVGAGERDFGLPGAKKLHAALVAAGSKRAELRVFANTEHLLVVQDALPEVFALFDRIAGVEGGSIEPLDPKRRDR
jgi:predicted esterase